MIITKKAYYSLYNSSNSSTYKPNGTLFLIAYGDGFQCSGTFCSDTVRLGNLTVTNHIFAQVNNFSTNKIFSYDGLLGLGFESIAESKSPTFLDNLFTQNQIAQKVFSFYLNRYF